MSDKRFDKYKRFAFRHALELYAWYGVPVSTLSEEQVLAWSDLRAECEPNTLRLDEPIKVRVVNPNSLRRSNPDLIG